MNKICFENASRVVFHSQYISYERPPEVYVTVMYK